MQKNFDPIRMGFIGYGRAVVQQHAVEMEPWKDRFSVVAVSVRSKDRQQEAHARYDCRTYTDYRELLSDPDVELVDITTPSVDHTRMAIAALEAGKHVFLEKPISISSDETEALQSAAGKSRAKLFVRHNRRFFSDFEQVKETFDSGLIGDVFLIRIRSMKFDLRDDWQTLKSRGGGLVLNVGPHFIDHCLAFLGWKYESLWADVKRVAATGDAEDHVKIIFKGQDGLIVDLEMSGGAAYDEVSYSALGKHGALTCDGNSLNLKYYDPQKVMARPARADTPDPSAPFGSGIDIPWIEESVPIRPPQRNIWDELYKAIREGSQYPITVEQSVKVMKVVEEVKVLTGE